MIKVGQYISPDLSSVLINHYQNDLNMQLNIRNYSFYHVLPISSSFEFDGVSGLPEIVAAFLFKFPSSKWNHPETLHKMTYLCAMPHDLEYAYGLKGDYEMKRLSDLGFKNRLETILGVGKIRSNIAYRAVQVLGSEKFSKVIPFAWGFANNCDHNIPILMSYI